MSKNTVRWFAIVFAIALSTTTRCHSAGNTIPGLGWTTGSARSVADSAPATSTTMSQAYAESSNSLTDGSADAAAASKKDPLYGYYPNDGSAAGASVGGTVSPGWSPDPGSSRSERGTGSSTSQSSSGCSSGCCSQ